MSLTLGSGVAFPLQVDKRGRLAIATGDVDIAQALTIILSTAPGERPMRPDFGCQVHDHVFDVIDVAAMGQIEQAVRAAVDRWEPRVEVVAVDFVMDRQEEGILDVELTYEIRDVPGVRNLVHPFYVLGEDADGEVLDGEVVL